MLHSDQITTKVNSSLYDVMHMLGSIHNKIIAKVNSSLYVEDNGSDAMLAAKWSAGVTPELNLREHVTGIPPLKANRAAFEIHSRRH